MEEERCGDCGVSVGEKHRYGCDLEICPFCYGQLISCECGYLALGLVSPVNSELHSYLPEKVYSNGLGEELRGKWLKILDEKGRIAFKPNISGSKWNKKSPSPGEILVGHFSESSKKCKSSKKEEKPKCKAESLDFQGFGSFLTKKYKGYTGRSAEDGREIKVPAQTMVVFKAGNDFLTEMQMALNERSVNEGKVSLESYQKVSSDVAGRELIGAIQEVKDRILEGKREVELAEAGLFTAVGLKERHLAFTPFRDLLDRFNG